MSAGASGLADAFEVMITKEDVKAPKPDPEGYRLALARLLRGHPRLDGPALLPYRAALGRLLPDVPYDEPLPRAPDPANDYVGWLTESSLDLDMVSANCPK